MKKRIAFVLCIVMLLSMVLAGCGKSYKVETDLTELKLQGEKEVKSGEDFAATLTPKGDFLLPEEITVMIDGSKLSAKKYTYDAETGEILIPGDEITGTIEIIAEGVELTLVGKWAGSVDLSELLNEAIGGADPTLSQYCNFHDISLVLVMEFDDDGVATLSVDSDSVEKLSETLEVQLTDVIYKYMEALLAESGLGMSVDDLLATQGYTMESFMAESFDVRELTSAFTDLNEVGNYLAEDGMLYISDDLSTDAEDVEANPYILEGDTLTIEATGNEDESEAFMYPLVLKRVG